MKTLDQIINNKKKLKSQFPGGAVVQNLPANAGDKEDTGQEDPREQEMVTNFSILAWKIP